MAKRPWVAFAAVGSVAAVVHVATAGRFRLIYVGSAVAAAIAGTVGLRRSPRPSSWGWRLVSHGLWLWAIGEILYYLLGSSGSAPTFPSAADPFYLAGYGFMCSGVLLITRRYTRESLMDALVLTFALGAVVWLRVIAPTLGDGNSGVVARSVAAAYPVADLLLGVPLFRLILSRSRLPATRMLAAGIALLLLADAVYASEALKNSYAVGNLVDAPWILTYTLLGAAMLHPSRAQVGREPVSVAPLTATRLIGLLGVVVLVDATETVHPLNERLGAAVVIAMIAVVTVRLVPPVRALARAATTDPLTTLPNRSYLVASLGEELASLRTAPGSVAVIFCDVDHFKLVNDSFGHCAGDQLLRGIAQRLRSAVGPGNHVARTSGDEFAIVAKTTDASSAQELADRIAASLAEPIVVAGTPIYPTMSMGSSCTEDPSATPEDLLRKADAAMYHAKDRGRARLESFSPELLVTAEDRLRLAGELHDAIPARELFAMFQPEINLATNEIFGFEALARWSSPRLGDVRPDRFIPVAEATGLIRGVFEQILLDTIEAQRAWRSRLGFVPSVALNASPRQLTDRSLPATIIAAIESCYLDPGDLWIEITESALAEPQDMRYVLDGLHEAGIRLAIDDFGTGWSSLARLARLPWDLIKIDRSFVADLGTDAHAEQVIAATIGLAHGMGIGVLAEGVETSFQADCLALLGCDYAQGYYIGGATTALEAAAHIDGASRWHKARAQVDESGPEFSEQRTLVAHPANGVHKGPPVGSSRFTAR